MLSVWTEFEKGGNTATKHMEFQQRENNSKLLYISAKPFAQGEDINKNPKGGMTGCRESSSERFFNTETVKHADVCEDRKQTN